MPLHEHARNEQNRKSFTENIYKHIRKLSENLGSTHRKFPEGLIDKAASILADHNMTAEKMNSQTFQKLTSVEKELRGKAKTGIVICIDGRLMPIHMVENDVDIWEEPGSLFKVEKRMDGKFYVSSEDLALGLQKTALNYPEEDVFDIVFAHTSLRTDHICGFAKALSNKKRVDGEENRLIGLKGEELAKKNLELLDSEQIPAMTNTYNSARPEGKKLGQVAVSALFDTDTYGIVLNYKKENEFSTTRFLESGLKEIIENNYLHESSFGQYKDDFTNPKFFIEFYTKLVNLTDRLINDGQFGFNTKINEYLSDNYRKLSRDQIKAFVFRLAKTTAFQYLTGLSHIKENGHPDHPFADHHERYATVTVDGTIINPYDVVKQSFKVTASSEVLASWELDQVALGLLDHYDDDSEKRHVVFVASTVKDLGRDSAAKEKNRKLFMSILENDRIKQLVRDGKLLLVPILVDKSDKLIKEIPQYYHN